MAINDTNHLVVGHFASHQTQFHNLAGRIVQREWQKCPICEGTGKIELEQLAKNEDGSVYLSERCHVLMVKASIECDTCHGEKMIESPNK